MMKKIRIATIAMVSIFFLSSCHLVEQSKNFTGGKEVSKSLNVKSFKKLNMKAFCDVHYTQADSVSVHFVGPQRILDKLRVISDGTTLVIEGSSTLKITNMSDIGDVDVYISSPDLIDVSLQGAGDFKVEGQLNTDTLQLSLSGAGDIEIESLICDKLNASLPGVGNIEINSIAALESRINVGGVGNIEAHFTQCNTVDCNVSGVGSIELSGTINQLRRNVSGVGTIKTRRLQVMNDK